MIDDRDDSNDADPPLTVTIEPSRNKNSYQAKEYRLNRIRHLLEKKTYHVQKWTMIFMVAYTGLTLIIAVASIVASYEARMTDSTSMSLRTMIPPMSSYSSDKGRTKPGKFILEISGSFHRDNRTLVFLSSVSR